MGWRIISGRRRVWCRHCSGNCTHRPTGQCTYTGTLPAANRSAECRTCARADSSSTQSALNRIVRIAAGGQGQERATRCCSWPCQTRHRFTPSSTGEVIPVGTPHSNAGRCLASSRSDRRRCGARAEGAGRITTGEIRAQDELAHAHDVCDHTMVLTVVAEARGWTAGVPSTALHSICALIAPAEPLRDTL